jgi:predicted ATPase/class 3 adenylate cyclase
MQPDTSKLPTGTVTFMFTDIEGSTRMLHAMGDGYRVVQDAHLGLLREAIAQGEGVELGTEGDAFFVVFAKPTGALRTAVAAQQLLAGHAWPEGVSLRVRMGLHTGEGILGGDQYLGMDVNRTARIAASAHGGQVLISDATRALVAPTLPSDVTLRDMGEHRLKDLPYPEHLYQLVIQGLPSDFPPPKSLDVRPNNLPLQMTSFVGRTAEVAAVIDRLKTARLLTLTGPGGTGKTRLALHVAADALLDFAHGAFFVDLSATSDPLLVPAALATALGVREDPARPLLDSVRDHLLDKEVLLVLDNFEQVLPATAVIDDLLKAAPKIKALVTSRSVLRLYGENEYPVPPLSLPAASAQLDVTALSQIEAVALFIERALAVNPGFRITDDNAAAVAAICVRLDGLPLAIELAASRAGLLSPNELLGRLEKRLSLSTAGASNLPERQRTLRGTLEWSYDLLQAPEQSLLVRLSVFAGGATVEAAEAVANRAGDLGVDSLEALGSLVEKSLLRRVEAAAESRFVMLETVREFGRERLEQSREVDDTCRHHAEFFAALSETAAPEFTGVDQAAWQDRFEREHDNLRAALTWSIESREPEAGLRIAASVWRFWQQRGHIADGRHWLDRLLALPESAGTTPLARAYLAAGGLAWWQADLETSGRDYEKSLATAQETGAQATEVEALFNLAYLPIPEGDLDRSWTLFEEALLRAEQLGDPKLVSHISGAMAWVALHRGDYQTSLALNDGRIASARESGDMFGLTQGLDILGQSLRMLGRHEESHDAHIEALDLHRKAGNLPGMLLSLRLLSALESARGQHQRAATLWGAYTALQEKTAVTLPSSLGIGDPVSAARAEIGDEATDRALEEGGAMSPDAAIEYAEHRTTG